MNHQARIKLTVEQSTSQPLRSQHSQPQPLRSQHSQPQLLRSQSPLKFCTPQQTIDQLLAGQIVALPTETVYGLAVCLNRPRAIQRLIHLKQRPVGSGKVFTLVPASPSDISRYVTIPDVAQPYLQQYLPGAATFILPKNPQFHHPYYDAFTTLGIRIPAFNLFQQILPYTGPLLLTSANHRAMPVVHTPVELSRTLPEVRFLADGAVGNQPPSTIIDFTVSPPKILRQGGLTIPL